MKKYFVLFLGILFLGGMIMSLPSTKNVSAEDSGICHHTSSQSNPWNYIEPNQSSSHLDDADDVPYAGDISWDKKDKELWCNDHNYTPPVQETNKTATISATKIVCDSESDLPNWGADDVVHNITSSTASNYVADHPNCHTVPWDFEWSYRSEDGLSPDPADNTSGPLGGDWKLFSSSEDAVINIDDNNKIGVKEVYNEDYIPFTGENVDKPISAEFYCGSDVFHYDNWEWIDAEPDQTYNCVAWNVLKEKPTEPEQCDVVSDTTNVIEDGTTPATETYVHPNWINSLPLAKWIWNAFHVVDPTIEETEVFTKTFTVNGPIDSATIQMAADNGYKLEINNQLVVDKLNIENNFSALQGPTDVESFLQEGTNTIKFTVKNLARPGYTATQNPAGLLYDLTVKSASCSSDSVPVGPKTGDVTMCKVDSNQNPLSGWTMMLLGDKFGSTVVNPTGSNFTIANVPAGNYVVKASGQYTYRGTTGAEYSDTAYSKRAPTDPVYITASSDPVQSPFLPWVRENNFPSPNTGWLGVMMNNIFTDWGSIFNPSHVYALGTNTGSTGDMTFKILDDQYSDNSGSINVDVYNGYHGVTKEDTGCVTFDNVPYGTYTADEIMKDGWENVSGLEQVTVDEPEETFTIVNRDTTIPEEPTTGNIEITKYVCPADTTVLRNTNGVGGTIPNGCTLQEGATFGYVHGSQTDANSPYPELTTPLTAGGTTNANGNLTISNLSPEGRYLIEETDSSNTKIPDADILGLYCVGDGDTSGNNDNQELTFVTAGETVHCVAYNKAKENNQEETVNENLVVKQADLANTYDPLKWFFFNDETDTIDNTLGSFVIGPATAPEGTGSAQMSVLGTQRRNIATYQFKDIKLADITKLNFSTYSQLAGDGSLGLSERAPYLNFNVDFNNSDTWQKRLVFVPGQNGVVTPDTWQTWDAIDGGNALWSYSGATWPTTTDPGTTLKTWSQILALYPNAETRSTDSWFGFRVGEPYTNGFTGNVDKFVMGVKNGLVTTIKTFDFEPTPEETILGCMDPNANNYNADATEQGENSCTYTETPTDMCPNITGTQETIPEGKVKNDSGDCVNAPTIRRTSSGSYVRSAPLGQVLGAETSCGIYVDKYLRKGNKNNDIDTVKKIQKFLNDYMKSALKEDGIFGAKTESELKKFQAKHSDDILKPWDLKNPTGIFYITTQTKVNNIMCPELNLPIPELTPLSGNL